MAGANITDLSNYINTSNLFQTSVVKPNILFSLLLLPIPITAIFGNLFIIFAVARFRSLQTSTNAFVVSLSAADFLVAVLVMPFSLVRSVDSWRFGCVFCQVHFLLDVSLSTSSIYNLCCIALDRYLAVCNPLHYPTRMSSRRVGMLLLFLCWMLPLVMSVIHLFFGMYKNRSSQNDPQICLAAFQIPFAITSSALSFFIPVGFILFAYGKIFMAAQRQMRRIHANMSEQSRTDSRFQLLGHSLKNQRKAAKSLGLIVGVFLICWLPFFCVNVVNPLKGYIISPLVLDVTLWLGYANSSLNPFIYATFNKCYRQAFVTMFGCETLGRHCRSFQSSQFGWKTEVTMETVSR